MVNRLAILALLLWLGTIAAGAYFFVVGTTTIAADGRQAVGLTPDESDHILAEMRGLLAAAAEIAGALARNDTGAIARIAAPVGMAATAAEPPILLAKLPLDFKRMGMQVHAGFDAIAAEAKAGASTQKLTGLLAEQLHTCVTCHAGYRFAR